MKRKISMFLCMVLVVTTMSGIGPIKVAEAAESTDFYTEKEAVTNYAYSFAVVGDTQIVTEYDVNNGTSYLSGMYDWILTNKEEKNIEYVFGLGDITDNNKEAEWALAKKQISKLDGKIPYSVIRGNHDLVGSMTPEDATADYFTEYLGTESYKSQFADGGFYSKENTWNSWRTLTVGNVDYLMLALDWGASDEVLSWASDIITEHCMHNVIITTHGYLYHDGTTIGTGEGGMSTASNNGEAMWEKLISKHENIVLVMSGHDPSEDIIVSQEEGVNGNIVTSMLIDPQDVDAAEIAAGNIPLGAVAMLYFSEDGRNIQVEYYATARQAYYKESNQFTLEVPVVSQKVDDCEKIVKAYSAEDTADYLAGEDTYPEVDGYIFAGWYTDESCDEDYLLAGKTPTGETYALFVPNHVMDVKAQVSANLVDDDSSNDETGSIRFVTTVDSLLYKEAGFEVSYVNEDGNTVSAKSASNRVYRRLYVLDGSNKWEKTPEGTFCGVSKYFKACTLKNVSMSKHYNTVFTIKPYFVTMDEDKVYGEAVQKSFAQGAKRKIFVDGTKWDVSKQFEGVVSLSGGGSANVPFYSQYTDIDLTLKNVKEYDTTGTKPGRIDVRFEFDIDGDGEFDKNTSFGVMTRDDGYTKVMTLGNNDNKWITTSRAIALYTLSDEEAARYKGDGIEFRIIRSGTEVDICIDGKLVVEFDLTQNESGITADTAATVTLRHYDATTDGAVVIPFEVSDVADTIFTREGATGTWDLTEKYNGVVTVDTTGNVVLPLAKKYTDIDMTLSGVKEYSSLHTGETTKVSRTDILFEFDTNNDGTTDKTTSFGIVKNGTGAAVKTLGNSNNFLTETRHNTLYSLSDEEVVKYNDLEQGVELRVVRSGKYIYVFVEGKQVSEFDITQNNSGVTEDMEAKVSLRHYDVIASGLSFSYDVSDEVKKVTLDITANENGTVTTNQVSHLEGTTVVWENSTKHFEGEKVVLTITPNEGYNCIGLQVDGSDVTNNLTANDDGTYNYIYKITDDTYVSVVPEFKREIFVDSETWDVSKQYEGVVTLPGGNDESLPFSNQYTDIDLTLKNVKEYDATGSTPGRTDVLFEFDTDGDGIADKSTSFGIMTRVAEDDYPAGTYVLTLGNDENHLTKNRVNRLYQLSDEEVTKYNGEGIEFRLIRIGTDVYIYVEGMEVAVFDLTQNESGVTADTKATVTLRHYDAVTDEVVVPFEVSDTVEKVFTTEGAGGKWNLKEKFRGVVYVDSTGIIPLDLDHNSVAIPFADKYKDIDITLKEVKEHDTTGNAPGRTDISFEFDTDGDGTADKSTSFGIMKRTDGNTYVMTLGNRDNYLTKYRGNQLYQLSEEEVEKYNGDGVELRVIRSGIYAYVFVEGKQVSVFDLTQNDSGVTARMEATVKLRYFDVQSEALKFVFEVSDKVEKSFVDIAKNENGVVAANTINYFASEEGVTKDSTKHFVGETVVLTVAPNEDYFCKKLLVNKREVELDNNTYTFVVTEDEYTVEAVYEPDSIFADSNKWEVTMSSLHEGVATLPGGGSANLPFSSQYTDIDLTLKNVKEYDTTGTKPGRIDVRFEFDIDGDGEFDKNTSFGVMTRDDGYTKVMTLGNNDNKWITTSRAIALYTLSDEEAARYKGDGIEFRIIRSGTEVDICIDSKLVVEFDLTQNESGITADTAATVTLRHYDAVTDEVVIPFEVSDVADTIFTREGATGTWDLTEKYNGVVTVDSTTAGNVVLPLAKKYTDIDMTLSGVKEYSSLHTVEGETKVSRTDILFEFDTNDDGTTDKTTSFGIVKNGTGAAVKTLGIYNNYITEERANTLYSLSDEEVVKYNNLEQGVELRVVRSGKYIYVFVEGKQVSEFDITQNNSGVTEDMEAKVSLRHYDVKASGLSFQFDVTDKAEEVELDLASNENGTVTPNQVSHLEGTSVVWENSTKHFVGETITLTVTPNEGYNCTGLQVNGNPVKLDNNIYTFVATRKQYAVEAVYEAE